MLCLSCGCVPKCEKYLLFMLINSYYLFSFMCFCVISRKRCKSFMHSFKLGITKFFGIIV